MGGMQADVQSPYGVAIQCRITSEDPEKNFAPDGGRIAAYRSPGGPGIRLDGAMASGNTVSRHYDSLLVKVLPTGRPLPHCCLCYRLPLASKAEREVGSCSLPRLELALLSLAAARRAAVGGR